MHTDLAYLAERSEYYAEVITRSESGQAPTLRTEATAALMAALACLHLALKRAGEPSEQLHQIALGAVREVLDAGQ